MGNDPQGATLLSASELQSPQPLCMIRGAAKGVHKWCFCEHPLPMFVTILKLRQDAASPFTLSFALMAFHGLHFGPGHGLAFPQSFPLVSQCFATRVLTRGLFCVWQPRSRIACWQSVDEAIYFPGFRSCSVGG